jgi:hypothetical protein
VDWFRFGLVTQRTRTYESERDIQRGILAGFSWKRVDRTTYVLDPDDDPAWVVAVGFSFCFASEHSLPWCALAGTLLKIVRQQRMNINPQVSVEDTIWAMRPTR